MANMSLDDDTVQTIQDAAREALMRERFGLFESNEGRMGADTVDELGNRYELKSATRTGVTTGRDLGMHTLQRYRTRYWIICRGTNLRRAGFVVDECRFLSPSMLEGWFQQIEARLRPDLELLERVLSVMRRRRFAEAEIERLSYLVHRGYTLNNPKIPWHYIESHGIRIEGDPKARLRRLVSEHPLHPGPD
jgi:hypothetical protein